MSKASETDDPSGAEYVDFTISGDESADDAWEKLKNRLVDGATSVEVIRAEDGDGFVLRTWWGERRDGSNSISV